MRNALHHLKKGLRKDGTHVSLILQRYLFEAVPGSTGHNEKLDILKDAIEASRNKQVLHIYRLAYDRWKNRLSSPPSCCLSKSDVFKCQGRLIIGLGSENVLEAGIALHHTYGMPYIPGSALKGLSQHYCHCVWGRFDCRFSRPSQELEKWYRDYLSGKSKQRPPDNFHRLLFGSTEDSGCIIFHDAWYIPEDDRQPLYLDVMTPHHLDYSRDSNKDSRFRAPTDFDSPNPIPFLSCSGEFLVAVSWRGPKTERAKHWLNLAFDLLAEALQRWGIGAKTTSGYGRLIQV